MIAILPLLVALGAIVGLIVLLVNPRTRPVGWGILAAVLLLAVLGWFTAEFRHEKAFQFRSAEVERSFTPADDIENSPPIPRPATRPRVLPVPSLPPVPPVPSVPRVPVVPAVPPVAADWPPADESLPHTRITVAWGALVGIALLLAGLATLLRNPRTRPIGVGVLVVLALLLPGAVLFWWVGAPSSAPMPVATTRPPPPSIAALSRSLTLPPDAIGSSREQGSAADKAPPRGGVLSAIGHALADVLPHNVKPSKVEVSGGSKPSSPAAKTAPPAAGRPDWVDAPPRYANNAYVMPIAVGPFETRQQCEAEVPQALQVAVNEYSAIYLGAGAAGRLDGDTAELRRRLVRAEWEEPVETSFGPMLILHLRLAFDRAMQDSVREAVRQETAAGRLRVAAIGLGGVLAVLGVLLCYLKLT
jgi:hypothetical protein